MTHDEQQRQVEQEREEYARWAHRNLSNGGDGGGQIERVEPIQPVPQHARDYQMIEMYATAWVLSWQEANFTEYKLMWQGGKCEIDRLTGVAYLLVSGPNPKVSSCVHVSFFNRQFSPRRLSYQIGVLCDQAIHAYQDQARMFA